MLDYALSETTVETARDNNFIVRNEERETPQKKFEDVELQTILDENGTFSQRQIAKILNVAKQTISDCLEARGKTHMSEKWEIHELNDNQMVNQKAICEILQKKKIQFKLVVMDQFGLWL